VVIGEKLTGKRRLRYHKGYLILQVEVAWYDTECVGGRIEGVDRIEFRDAKIEDLTTDIPGLDNLIASFH